MKRGFPLSILIAFLFFAGVLCKQDKSPESTIFQESDSSQKPPGSENLSEVVNDGYGDYLLVPVGEFEMGDNFNEGFPDERPVHKVYLSAYYIGKYEVTNDEYEKFMDDGGYENPSFWNAGGFGEYGIQPLYWDNNTDADPRNSQRGSTFYQGRHVHGCLRGPVRDTGSRLRRNGKRRQGDPMNTTRTIRSWDISGVTPGETISTTAMAISGTAAIPTITERRRLAITTEAYGGAIRQKITHLPTGYTIWPATCLNGASLFM